MTKIIVVGDVGSGKTAYFTMAMWALIYPENYFSQKLRNDYVDLYNEEITIREYEFDTNFEQGDNAIESNLDQLLEQQRFPESTRDILLVGTPYIHVTSNIKKNGQVIDNLTLENFDFPGEVFKKTFDIISSSYQRKKNNKDDLLVKAEKKLIDTFKSSNGAIFIVEKHPDSDQNLSQDELLTEILTKIFETKEKSGGLFRRRNYIPFEKIAFLISKADLIDERKNRSPRDYLMSDILPLATRIAEKKMGKQNVRYYWMSAVGKVNEIEEVKDDVASAGSTKKVKYIPIKPPRPYGVLEPLLWITGVV